MCANGTNLGSLLSDNDMSAVGALPYHIIVTGEYKTAFHVFEKL